MGRVVGITGGTRGIGKAIADLFTERGDTVEVASRSTGYICDQVGTYRFMDHIMYEHRRLDVFINNVGMSQWSSIDKWNEQDVVDMFKTNTLSTLWGCAEAAKVMKTGSIVNVSSLAGKRGSANNSVYCATKFAVNGITQSLAKELGPRGIRVNAVCPWYVTTPGLASALNGPLAPHIDINETALGRMPTAEEVAQVVYWLASDQASAITGQCINVDCGAFPQ